eukprot:1310840-Prymnesium_polylepis.1
MTPHDWQIVVWSSSRGRRKVSEVSGADFQLARPPSFRLDDPKPHPARLYYVTTSKPYEP